MCSFKYFTKFVENLLCWSLFLFKNCPSDIGVFLWNMQNVLEQLLQKHVNNTEPKAKTLDFCITGFAQHMKKKQK